MFSVFGFYKFKKIKNLRKIKNQECLIRAISDLDVYLVIVGKGEMKNKLKALTHELKLDNNVIFIDSMYSCFTFFDF